MTKLYRSIHDDIRVVPASQSAHHFELDAYETSLMHLAMDIAAADTHAAGYRAPDAQAFTQTLGFYGAYRTRRGSWSLYRTHPERGSVNPIGGMIDPARTAAVNDIYAIINYRKLQPNVPSMTRQLGVGIVTRNYTHHETMHLLSLGAHSIPKDPEVTN